MYLSTVINTASLSNKTYIVKAIVQNTVIALDVLPFVHLPMRLTKHSRFCQKHSVNTFASRNKGSNPGNSVRNERVGLLIIQLQNPFAF